MTNPGTGTGLRLIPGLDGVPEGQCPKCLSKKVLAPRIVKNHEEWCNCYRCGHAWQTNKPKVRKGWNPKLRKVDKPNPSKTGRPKLTWNPKEKTMESTTIEFKGEDGEEELKIVLPGRVDWDKLTEHQKNMVLDRARELKKEA